ncbi:hypothetical protein FQN60_010509 [Etheostoma spectabile]|uniref:Uncharacterized protein n=1 Tax=Etheostoma spectabile TaxID=54343 RepID=A0A5J5D710_9PERO|nr:hypothetical protein FQN60_010509 [Etheostoma spectabile]
MLLFLDRKTDVRKLLLDIINLTYLIGLNIELFTVIGLCFADPVAPPDIPGEGISLRIAFPEVSSHFC